MTTPTVVMVLTLVTGVAARAGANLNLPVPLTVKEPVGLERISEPVTTGLPFAPGVLRAGIPLRLLDSTGGEVPLQTRILARWPDGSVKWLLLDLQASVPPGRAVRFRLAPGKPTSQPIHPLRLREERDRLVIDTGAMVAALSRKVFDLFSSVRVGGREVLASRGGGLVITDLTGTSRNSREHLSNYRLEVVERGPLRTVLRAAGEVQATSRNKLGFTCWYHFYAGKKYVRVFFTVRNLAGRSFTQTDQHHVQDLAYQRQAARHPGNLLLEAVELVLDGLELGEDRSCLLGGDQPIQGTLREGPLTLYQDSSASWPWQVGTGKITDPLLQANREWMAKNAPPGKRHLPYWEYDPAHYRALLDKRNYVGCSFRGYRVYDAKGEVLARGDRARGFARLGRVAVAVRWFWQMYPKSLTLQPTGAIRIGLWPKRWSSPHLFEGHVHKTHELLFDFDARGGAAEVTSAVRCFDRRLLATAPKEYYCATGAFAGYLMPENRKEFPRFEDWALTAVKCGVNPRNNPGLDSSFRIEREKYDLYGVWHFGDDSKRGWRGFGQYQELDIPYCLVVHFVRTLNRAFFDEAEIHVRELMDVPAHGGGYGHQKGESSHYYTTGPLLYYYLTGLEFIRRSIKVSHDLFARPSPWHARSFAITMWSNLDMYRAFGGEEYLQNVRADLRWFLGDPRRPRQDPVTGFRHYGRTNFQEFMLGMMMDALGRYCMEFPKERIWRDRLVALSNATIRTHRVNKWRQNISCASGHAYAYLFTGRDKYLDFAIELMDQAMPKNDPHWPRFRTGTCSAKSWSEFGHRLSQTAMWARWYRRHNGTPTPPSPITDLTVHPLDDGRIELTWTAPGQDGNPVDFYIIKAADKPLKDDLTTREEGRTAANWWTTPLLNTPPPVPADPGEKQTMTLTIPVGKTLYLAIRSVKQVGPISAVSDLSNLVRIGRR